MMTISEDFFLKFKKLWQTFKEEYKTPYRLVEIQHQDHEKYAVIGLRYSHMMFKRKLQDAVLDDHLLSGLSPQDIRSLSMYAMFCCTQARFELISIDYVGSEKLIFSIKDKHSGQIIKMNQEEFNRSPDIINHFKRDELYKVGFICGNTLNEEE